MQLVTIILNMHYNFPCSSVTDEAAARVSSSPALYNPYMPNPETMTAASRHEQAPPSQLLALRVVPTPTHCEGVRGEHPHSSHSSLASSVVHTPTHCEGVRGEHPHSSHSSLASTPSHTTTTV